MRIFYRYQLLEVNSSFFSFLIHVFTICINYNLSALRVRITNNGNKNITK